MANFFSYRYLKNKILKSQKWDLNICCGKTDGGGVNADIYQHKDVPQFCLIENIYKLPFIDGQFESVLCSHTMEHVDDPEKFYNELRRVGKNVTLVLPPLYDIVAVCNVFEYKWIFLSFKKKHSFLPPRARLSFSGEIQKRIGQINNA